jgi:hypothetical protein
MGKLIFGHTLPTFFTRTQAPGAMPNETRVTKIASEKSDQALDGEFGTIVGSIGPLPYRGDLHFVYFVEWDNFEGLFVAVPDVQVQRFQ